MSSKFIVTGDSWSRGEWDGYPVDYKVTHSGIHQYLLEDGHSVVNVGCGGFNNLQSLAAVKEQLNTEKFHHCVFFFTDPLRQSTYEEFSQKLPKTIIAEHIDFLARELNNLRRNYGIKITVVGGCAKYASDTGFDYVVPSITELLVPDFEDSYCMDSWEWTDHVIKLGLTQTAEHRREVNEILEQGRKKMSTWGLNRDLFWPDGLHANRKGHKILYKELLRLWQ